MEYVVDCIELAHDVYRVWRRRGGSWDLAVSAVVNVCVEEKERCLGGVAQYIIDVRTGG